MTKSLYLIIFILSASLANAALVDDIVQLKQLGLDDDILTQSVLASEEKIVPQDLIKFKHAGFSNELIKKLLMAKASLQDTGVSAKETHRIIVQHKPMQQSGEVELTLHTHARGAKLHLDGKLLGVTQPGANRFNVPTGKHLFKLEHGRRLYEELVNIEVGKANILYIYHMDDATQNSIATADKFLSSHKREFDEIMKLEFRENVRGSGGEALGIRTKQNIKAYAQKSIRIYDTVLTRFVVTAVTAFNHWGTDRISYSGEEIMFYFDMTEDLEIKKTVHFFETALNKFNELVEAYKLFDQRMIKINYYQKRIA